MNTAFIIFTTGFGKSKKHHKKSFACRKDAVRFAKQNLDNNDSVESYTIYDL